MAHGLRAGIITASDRSSSGQREDATGPALKEKLEGEGIRVELVRVVPDEKAELVKELRHMVDELSLDLVVTTGGTGIGPRDVTPEATEEVSQRILPGIGEAMRMRSLEQTPRAMLSRATAGVRGSSLIVNLPGSPRGAVFCLDVVMPVIRHALELARGKASDCAPSH